MIGKARGIVSGDAWRPVGSAMARAPFGSAAMSRLGSTTE